MENKLKINIVAYTGFQDGGMRYPLCKLLAAHCDLYKLHMILDLFTNIQCFITQLHDSKIRNVLKCVTNGRNLRTVLLWHTNVDDM